jgi:hypothetical protein
MQPGDPFGRVFRLVQPDGSLHSGEAANISVTAYVENAAASLSASVVEKGATGVYEITGTLPSTAGFLTVFVDHSGTSIAWPQNFVGEIESYDLAALVGLLSAGTGTIDPESRASSDLGEVVDGDAWDSLTIEVDSARLSRIGLSDLTGGTISAAARTGPGVPATPVTLSAAFVSAPNNQVKFSWDTFPVALALGDTDDSQTWYVDIQFKHTATGKIISIAQVHFTVVWQKDETT